MKKIKLSATQQGIIDKMKNGTEITLMKGISTYAYLSKYAGGHVTVNIKTLNKLEELGLVVAYSSDWKASDYTLNTEKVKELGL